jgi:hypothetical protein
MELEKQFVKHVEKRMVDTRHRISTPGFLALEEADGEAGSVVKQVAK